MAAATALAAELHLRVDDTVVIHNSNKLALRLLPCGVFARVALAGQEAAALEVELALRLAGTASPVAALEPRVEPRVYERDGFAVTLWTYYEVVAPDLDFPGAYADVLQRLHTGMRSVEIATPHFLDRAAEAERLVTRRDETPALAEADRHLLLSTLQSARERIHSRGAAEQLLHGEPHPGNLLSTRDGLLFIDFETCCRGPIEFDVAHVPEEVSARYPDVDSSSARGVSAARACDGSCADGARTGRTPDREQRAGGPPSPTSSPACEPAVSSRIPKRHRSPPRSAASARAGRWACQP